MKKQPDAAKRKPLLIRRAIAIVLTVAAVVGLFLPMISLGEDAKYAFARVKTEDGESCRVFLDELPRALKQALKDEQVKPEYQRIVANAAEDLNSDVVLPLYGFIEDGRISFLEFCKITALPSKALNVLNDNYDDLEEALEEFGKLDEESAEAEEQILSALSAVRQLGAGLKALPIVFYTLFFLTLALGVAAIVMCVLNRSKLFGILFVCFALICALFFAAVIVLPRVLIGDVTSFSFTLGEIGTGLSRLANAGQVMLIDFLPGIGLILLSVLSLAGCIVYKRDRSYAGILPKRGTAAAAPAPQRTAPGGTGWKGLRTRRGLRFEHKI